VKLLDQGMVCDASKAAPSRRFCAFTNTTVLSDGRVLVAFHAGSAKEAPDENVLMRLSADGGRTWEVILDGLEPLTIDGKLGSWHHGRVTELAPGHLLGAFWWLDRSAGRPMINPETTGTLPNRIFLLDSFDDGRTWTNRREVDTWPFPSVALMGAPLVLAGGSVAVVSEAWKSYDDAGFGEHSAILSISHDGGYTFDSATVVAHDPANRLLFWDERLAVDPETGRLIGMFWTHDRVAQLDVNAHVAWSQTTDGKSWSYPRDTGVVGQLPRPLPLPSGRVLCIYVHRHWPPSLRAILSPDFGKTWDVQGELVFYEHPFGPQAGMDGQREFTDYYEDMRLWNFGLADPGLLPDGDVFVAFYAGDSQSLSIRWVRLAI
jgi:sialidase-1